MRTSARRRRRRRKKMFNTVDESHRNGATNPFDCSTDPFGISSTDSPAFPAPNQFDDQPFVAAVRPRSGKDALLSTNWLAYQHSMDEANLDADDETTSVSVPISSRNPFDLPTSNLPDELHFETKPIEPNRSFYDFLGFNLTDEPKNPFDNPLPPKSNPFEQTDRSTKKVSRHDDDDDSDDETKMTFTIKEKRVASTDETLPLPIPLLPPPPSSQPGDKSRRSSTSSSEPDDNDPLSIFRTRSDNPPAAAATTTTNASLITDWDEDKPVTEAKVCVVVLVRLVNSMFFGRWSRHTSDERNSRRKRRRRWIIIFMNPTSTIKRRSKPITTTFKSCSYNN